MQTKLTIKAYSLYICLQRRFVKEIPKLNMNKYLAFHDEKPHSQVGLHKQLQSSEKDPYFQ